MTNLTIFLKKHRFLFLILAFLLVVSFVLNLFLKKNTAFLFGEYVFSFDYSGHIRNIINDFRSDPSQLLRTNNCENCPNFIHYSRWYTLIEFNILNIGKLIGLNPLIFYLWLTASSQLAALYLFCHVFLGKLNKLAFLISAVVFIIFPIKFSYLASGGLNGIIYAVLLASFSLLFLGLKNIESAVTVKIVKLGVLTGLSIFFIFNIGIGFSPIFIYTTLLLLAYFFNKIRKNLKQAVLFLAISFLIPFFLNLPLVLSVFLNKNQHVFTTFIPLNLVQSLTSRMAESLPTATELSPVLILVFFYAVLILFLISRFGLKTKVILITIYFLAAVLMAGDYLFNFLFYHLPLMNTLRSVHRLIFFQQLVLFIIIYGGIKTIELIKSKLKYLLIAGLAIILVGIPALFIKSNFGLLYKTEIPAEYFELKEYLADDKNPKIYFPFYLPLHQSFNENFSWMKKPALHKTLYGNPYISLFALPNMIQADAFPSVEENILELRSLFDYQRNSPAEIIETLKLHGIKYLIIDNNFDWQKNFPAFDFQKITQNLKLEKQFGNLYLYSLENKKAECKKSFGDFRFGYCHISGNEIPDYFINATEGDYLLERFSLREDTQKMKLKMGKNIYHNVANPALADYIIGNKINQHDLWQIDNSYGNNSDNVFTVNLPQGEYELVIPILKTNIKDNLFKEAHLEVSQKNLPTSIVQPYGSKIGINYDTVYLKIKDNMEPVKIKILGEGFLATKTPFVVKKEEWPKIFEFKLNN